MDLTDLKYRDQLNDIFKREGISKVMNTTCKGQGNWNVTKKLLPTIMETIESNPRYNRTKIDDYNLLVIGVPNVGKSSLINILRRSNLGKGGKPAAVGSKAGVTKSVMEKIKILDAPRVYIFDSPGILHPNITDMDVGMKLALCATIKDHFVGAETIVDYMLYQLNKYDIFRYVRHYNLPNPTDNVVEFLAHIAKQKNYTIKKKSSSGTLSLFPDFNRTANIVLKDFREGQLGLINLDGDIIDDLCNNRNIGCVS